MRAPGPQTVFPECTSLLRFYAHFPAASRRNSRSHRLWLRNVLKSPSELDRARELQRAHRGAGGKSRNLSGVRALNVAVRCPEVGMVEGISGVGAQNESDSLGDVERLRE